jgi:hypothetical protein
MLGPIARLALVIAMLAAGYAAVSTAHEPTIQVRTCGSLRDKDNQSVGVMIERGRPDCATAKKVLRTYQRSDKPCEGVGVRSETLRLVVPEREGVPVAAAGLVLEGQEPGGGVRAGRLSVAGPGAGVARRPARRAACADARVRSCAGASAPAMRLSASGATQPASRSAACRSHRYRTGTSRS